MNTKRSAPRLVVALTLIELMVVVAACGSEVQIGINAAFDHSSQPIPFRTLVSIAGPWRFDQGAEGKMFARFLAEREGGFATASWETTGQPIGRVGPAIICLANTSVNADQFNLWLVKPHQRGIDPSLVIPLQRVPRPPNEPAPNVPQGWANPAPVAARIFLRGCDDEEFRRYGDLHFAPGALRFMLQVNFKGALQVELSAQPVLLNLDADTWEIVKNQCDGQQVLPAACTSGFSQDFHGTSGSPAPDPETLSGKFGFLFDQIEFLSFRGGIDKRTAAKLESILAKAVSALQEADASKEPTASISSAPRWRKTSREAGSASMQDSC